MERGEIIFAISKVGASHLPKGIPCQDYSLAFSKSGVRLIIVCDGHGSETYVRSDMGARLAAEVTKDALLCFIETTPIGSFSNKKGAVTARPIKDDSLWGTVPDKPLEDMTEMELLRYRQDKLFFEQVGDIREQDTLFVSLFNKIYENWLKAIHADSEQHPFTEAEKRALGSHDLVKAYGTTLMAYVETPHYWFSFHIGDGRVVCMDECMEITTPVPWDCGCFQNYTTSLCNTNPVARFRYAFDGTGHFPAAVFCCSDGVEDSFGDYDLAPDYLHNWYLGLLNEFVKRGKDITLQNINNFLPILSQKGSKDDISLAAIIDMDHISSDVIDSKQKAVIIKKQIDELETQKKRLNQQLSEIEQYIAKFKCKTTASQTVQTTRKKWILF
jgi:hypothetical protein